ncbi:MAG TPA: hypothetical protein VNZ55_10230 [Thermomicrobiales bacterium]|nr:hypothetical protein [Thermomicrobiales bacterium]
MQPYKRRRRNRRDMIVLGGWLFADLLLGLAMLFAVANTVGAPAPPPTPTPMPDYLATSEAQVAQANVSAQQTVEAMQSSADAEATRSAMSASQRATEDAKATDEAVVARATIEALSTEQAASQSNEAELNAQLATNVAQATEVASQLQAQGTEQARLSAVATEQAASGATVQGTIAALQGDLATSEANSASAQQRASDAEATSAAAQSQLSQAQQQVQLNSLNPNAVTETIQVDLNGVIRGDTSALDDARDALDAALAPYMSGQACRIGFVNISSRAPDIGQGIQLSDRMAELIETDFPQLLPEPPEGETPRLASESIALPNTTPSGEVELQLFLSSGCEPAG